MKGNVSRGDGGAIDNSSDLTLTNSEISGNFAALGGGIYSAGLAASLTITNSTITENPASIGGGLLNIGQASLINLTLSENSADTDGGVYNQVPQGLTLRNTIIANNVGGDCGGPAQTEALLPGSPAIDAGDNADCPATDQRGQPRPMDGDLNGSAVCDIGA